MPARVRQTALRAAATAFAAAQLVVASGAATGSHRHAWDLGVPSAACWICLVISLTSVVAVLGAGFAFSEGP